MTNENQEVSGQELDPEIYAMHLLAKALGPLEHPARQRVLDYARKRFLDAGEPSFAILRSTGGPTRPITLDDLGLLTRSLESLKSFMQTEGLAGLTDFRFVPEPMVLKLRGMGDKSLRDFKTALAQVGVVLGSDFPRGTDVREWKSRMQQTKAAEAEGRAAQEQEEEGQ